MDDQGAQALSVNQIKSFIILAALRRNVSRVGKALSVNQIKSFIILAALRRNVSRVGKAHLRVILPIGNTAPFEEMLQPWRVVGNTVSNLTGPRFEPQTSRSRDERVTTRPTGRSPSNSIICSMSISRG